MPPLDNMTAFIVDARSGLPPDRLERLAGYFTIGVGGPWREGFAPAVSLAGGAGEGSVQPLQASGGGHEPIALSVRSGPLPRYPNPNFLHRLADPVAVAALWAVGLGCYPVIVPGGRRNRGGDLARLLAMRYRPPGLHHPTLWVWTDDRDEFNENMSHRHVQPVRAPEMAARIREYFDHGPIRAIPDLL